MKKIVIAIAALCVALGFVVFFFPTALPTDHDRLAPLSRSDFALLRQQAIDAGESLRSLGITVVAGDPRAQSLQFECNGVPELILMNDEEFMFSVLTSAGAAQRAPQVVAFRDRYLQHLRRLPGQPVEAPAALPGPIEAFVLRERDGIDLRVDCSR